MNINDLLAQDLLAVIQRRMAAGRPKLTGGTGRGRESRSWRRECLSARLRQLTITDQELYRVKRKLLTQIVNICNGLH